MRNKITILKVTVSFMLIFNFYTAKAQLFDFKFFEGGVEDGLELFVPYISPYINAFGTDLNGGWFNSAKPHKPGGFDITFTTSVTKVPAADQQFDLADLTFQNLNIVGSGTTTPTIAGSTDDGPDLEYRESGVVVAAFTAPPGTGIPYMPAPMLQAGVGLPFGTEVIIRYMPTMKIPQTKASLGLWGLGVKHSIFQHFKTLDKLPVDVSFFFGYTRLKSKIGVTAEPVTYDYLTSYTPDDFTDQYVQTATGGYNVSIIASTTLPVINVYGAMGYSKSQTDVDFVGNIPIPAYDPGLNPNGPVVRDEDVITLPNIEVKNLSGLRTTIGLRLKLAVVTLHADYTYAKYSVYTGGVGFHFR